MDTQVSIVTPEQAIQLAPPGAKAVNVILRDVNNTLTRQALVTSMRKLFDILADMAGESLDDYRDVWSDRYLYFAWESLRFQHCQAVRTRLEALCGVNGDFGEIAPSTANKVLGTLRIVISKLALADLIPEQTARRVADGLKPIKVERRFRGRALKPDEVTTIIRTLLDERTVTSVRNATMITIGIQYALRTNELVKMHTRNYDVQSGRIDVIGKGNKQITVFLHGPAKDMLERWMAMRGDESGYIFCVVYNNVPAVDKKLKHGSFWMAIKRMCDKYDLRPFTPHDLKRTAITNVHRATNDLEAARLVGHHASQQTTSRHYLDRDDELESKRQAEVNGLMDMDLPFL